MYVLNLFNKQIIGVYLQCRQSWQYTGKSYIESAVKNVPSRLRSDKGFKRTNMKWISRQKEVTFNWGYLHRLLRDSDLQDRTWQMGGIWFYGNKLKGFPNGGSSLDTGKETKEEGKGYLGDIQEISKRDRQ